MDVREQIEVIKNLLNKYEDIIKEANRYTDWTDWTDLDEEFLKRFIKKFEKRITELEDELESDRY